MNKILDWSEAWAVLIPVIVYLIKKPVEKYSKVVFIYLIIAFVINSTGDLIVENYYHEPQWIININYNQPFYNAHSIARLILFAIFFSLLRIPSNRIVSMSVFIVVCFFIFCNFLFFISFTQFSSVLFAIEAIVLIVYCILYFLTKLRSDEVQYDFDPSLYMVTGLALYEAVCFPIFLFYDTLINVTEDYAVSIWDVHNITYIVFCLFIARAYYGTTSN